jgi:diguanylate cyclase (GGDEF)-like protein
MTIPEKSIPFRSLIVVAVTVIGMSAVAAGVTILGLRADAIREAERDCTNNALFVADQLARSIQPVEALLKEFRDRVPEMDMATPGQFRSRFDTEQTFQVLRDRLARIPQASVILLLADDGSLITSTRRWPSTAKNYADREYFRHANESDVSETHVSGPMTSRTTGQSTVYFSKRVNGSHGEFIGVVAVGVEVKYFNQIYDTYSSLVGRTFIVSRSDGQIIANRPGPMDLGGRKIPEKYPWYDVVKQGGGSYWSPGYLDGRPRLVSAQPVPGAPLVVSVGIVEATALATWRHRAISIGVGTLLAVTCALGLLWALTRQFRRVLESKVSLAEREASLKEKSDELEQANIRLDAALNNMSHGLCMFGPDGRVLVCNDRYRRMYRLSPESTRPGITPRELMEARIAAGTFAADAESYVTEFKRTSLAMRPVQFTAELTDGRVVSVINEPMPNGGFVSVHEDITERQRSQMRIAHMARHDPLTDLANRALFRERMDEALARLERNGPGFSVFVFDIDLFKSVNDSLGHAAGDALLNAVAQRLRLCVTEADTVGRIGGDEFAVVQIADDGAGLEDKAVALAQWLLDEIRKPYHIDGERIVIGISIGIAVAPRDGTEPSQILKNADLALYRAKSDGRGCFRFFQPEMDADVRQQREFEFQLREALIRQEFEIHFQPIVDIATHRPCAVEALVRWRHPQRGLIPPDKFIPVAEEIGLIIPLGEWILSSACRTAAAWPDHIRLAVNLSAVQFRSGNLVEVVRDAIARSGLPATRLELEITESVLLQKDHGSLAVLHDLAALGVHIVLDDFGTGYSSLSYLQMFPFSKIKIDRSFVADMSSRSDCAAIVCTVLNLAKALDMGTTAEGVETWEQVDLLRAAGCREAQGWLFGRPGPAATVSFETLPATIEDVAA